MFDKFDSFFNSLNENVGQLRLWFKTTAAAQVATVVVLLLILFKRT